ncbi:glycoside hydrolase family 13 protein [Spongiivirga citrea]|uniref:Alpha-glucosidase n=1 Tax=Spongiivirga citrea TaxID=1481457 RepID=A0A6M0CDA8_9FLAO|nr:alpha-glucosidase [Spongiivirga citrea]NER15701.1 alpha-glucosidase [Spongiivirga citrea]
MAAEKKWWKEGIVYQIYPRSFNDTSGNGIGDLRGIIEKLDYIKSIGVDIIWLNPIYKSPNDDNGYDISDYQNIMSEFGTMADFDELLYGMHNRGLKLIMDLVVNHSSDEHEWFQQSKSSRDNEYRDYYHWWPAEKGTPPKRWSYFDVNSDAWKYDEQTDSYYLHYFSQKQPDLKWENPKLRSEIYKMMAFWFEKGIDGFRMDVIPFISKDTSYPELPADAQPEDFVAFYANGPKLHNYLREMNDRVLSQYDVMTVGEAPGIAVDHALDFVDEDRKELNMFFHFDLMTLDRDPDELFTMNKDGWKLSEFKKIHTKWDKAFANKGWGSMFLSNHDFPRSVSRWGNDDPEFWRNSATLLQTFLLTMRGTPYFYYGDEIGMTNIRFNSIEEYRDINTINKYKQLQNQGKDFDAFIENEKDAARDNARTPMQWDESTFAGFSTTKPWISVNQNYKSGVTVKAQEDDKYSVLNYFRKMCAIRKSNEALIYGEYKLIDETNEQVYAYTRSLEDDCFLILLNFSTDSVIYTLPSDINYNAAKLIVSNDRIKDDKTYKEFLLLPYQAIVYKLL